LRANWIAPGAVVIDIGMNRRPDGGLTGDVAFAECAEVAGAITPVPGGVGPMTIACLLENTVKAAEARRGGGPAVLDRTASSTDGVSPSAGEPRTARR
jgi:methylenetetrahydrofolate dehydrogenase (NADP+)/methenyltetrahydrofolate cyclohydrolase